MSVTTQEPNALPVPNSPGVAANQQLTRGQAIAFLVLWSMFSPRTFMASSGGTLPFGHAQS
ncbi:MAG: hypothetical protein ACI8X5_002896 [Planctomycetota bacterium]|jgi:hypothetical protein